VGMWLARKPGGSLGRRGGRCYCASASMSRAVGVGSIGMAAVEQESCLRLVKKGRKWDSADARREFVAELARRHGVEKSGDWKRVTRTDVAAAGGAGLLKRYGNSMFLMLKDCSSDSEQLTAAAVRPRARKGHWSSWQNRRDFMEEVAAKLRVQSPADWARVRVSDVVALGGGGLLKRYGDSVMSTVRDLFPEQWQAEEGSEGTALSRKGLPKGHWDSAERRREFVEELRRKFAVETAADWKRVRASDVAESGGAGLLARYGFSLHALLLDTAAEEEREALAVFRCRFQTPRKYFADDAHVATYLRQLRHALGIERDEDWFRLSAEQLRIMNGRELVRSRGLVSALSIAFPDTNWDLVRQNAPPHFLKKSSQRNLCRQVHAIFL